LPAYSITYLIVPQPQIRILLHNINYLILLLLSPISTYSPSHFEYKNTKYIQLRLYLVLVESLSMQAY